MNGFAFPGFGSVDWVANGLVVAATAGLLVLLLGPRLRRSVSWRATATPLASIIGSGFLVITPLLALTVGVWGLAAMAGLVGLAWLVGGAVRYNIAHLRENGEKQDGEQDGVPEGPSGDAGENARAGAPDDAPDHTRADDGAAVRWMERAGRLWLAIAYVIAVAFYVELLGAFLMRGANIESHAAQKGVATAILLFIGGFGYWRGLRTLEGFEKVAVDVKLAIIGGLLAGLAWYNADLVAAGDWKIPTLGTDWSFRTLRELLGAFLVIQGFETSRYLASAYSAERRIRTMRYAQLCSAAVYLLFVGLATVLFGEFRTVSETSIIDLSHRVAYALPWLLILGAVMSQFGAAVADTIGAGGLVEEATGGRIRPSVSYAIMAALAISLLWVADIFEVIAFASRAFALYYALQCAVATTLAWRRRSERHHAVRAAGFAVLTLAMIAVAVLGVPAEAHNGG